MKKNTLIILMAFTLALCAAVAVYVLMFLRIGTLVDASKDAATTLAVDKTRADSMKTSARDIKQTLGFRDVLNGVFVTDDNAPDFIQSIQSIMDSENISGKIDSVDDKSNTALDAASKEDLLVSMEAIGSYSQIMKFVSLLEFLPYKSYITNLMITKNGASAQTVDKTVPSGSWSVTLTLDVVKTKAAATQ